MATKSRGARPTALDEVPTKGYVDANAQNTPRLTKLGNQLQVNGITRRFGATNMYWTGVDDNGGTPAGAFPSRKVVSDAVRGAREMGVGIIRAHTVGMSAGFPFSFETAPGVFVDANLDRADWTVAEAKRNGIYLMTPLTDNWNYYHGGKWNFVHWAYQQNPSGIVDVNGTVKDSNDERIFFANTAAGLRIRALFKEYIAAWLNHVNPYTLLAYKDDPTIAIVELGNEMYYASQLGTDEWTQDIASYIKSIAPNKLVADGSGADRVSTLQMPGRTAAAVDILSPHYYPQEQGGSYPAVAFASTLAGYASSSALAQLPVDAANAKAAGKVMIVGEYPWTRSDVAAWHTAIMSNPDIAAAAFWSIIGNDDAGNPLTHGNAFGQDDYPVHRPYAGTNEQTYAPALAAMQATLTAWSLGGTTDVQIFTAAGTWTKPAAATSVYVVCIGGGGGGGSGRRGAAATARGGGGGGGGGGFSETTFPASVLPSTVAVAVGSQGLGGSAAASDPSNGNGGSAGGASSFGTYLQASGGGAGGGGTTGAGSAGGAGVGQLPGGGGSAGSTGAANASGASQAQQGAPGGGGGGGLSTANAVLTPGSGGISTQVPDTAATNGAAGTSRPAGLPQVGAGGAGGPSSASAAGTAGGAGGIYGTGGGGGGAGASGFASGAGGNGAPGIVVVITAY